MTPSEFKSLALATESRPGAIQLSDTQVRLLHGAMGLVTEAGEIMDMLKKHIFYGRPLDMTNLLEELGDSNWYQQILLDTAGLTQELVWETVIKKLQVRYPGKFVSENAINRNLDAERFVLQSNCISLPEG